MGKENSLLIGIADDHIQGVNFISNELESRGFETVWAYTGKDTLKMCKENKVDLLIVDARFDGTTAFDVLKELPKQKFIIMSADENILEQAKKIKNYVGGILKPVNIDDIVALIKK